MFEEQCCSIYLDAHFKFRTNIWTCQVNLSHIKSKGFFFFFKEIRKKHLLGFAFWQCF